MGSPWPCTAIPSCYLIDHVCKFRGIGVKRAMETQAVASAISFYVNSSWPCRFQAISANFVISQAKNISEFQKVLSFLIFCPTVWSIHSVSFPHFGFSFPQFVVEFFTYSAACYL